MSTKLLRASAWISSQLFRFFSRDGNRAPVGCFRSSRSQGSKLVYLSHLVLSSFCNTLPLFETPLLWNTSRGFSIILPRAARSLYSFGVPSSDAEKRKAAHEDGCLQSICFRHSLRRLPVNGIDFCCLSHLCSDPGTEWEGRRGLVNVPRQRV